MPFHEPIRVSPARRAPWFGVGRRPCPEGLKAPGPEHQARRAAAVAVLVDAIIDLARLDDTDASTVLLHGARLQRAVRLGAASDQARRAYWEIFHITESLMIESELARRAIADCLCALGSSLSVLPDA